MHALLAHAYHLARFGLHVVLLPLWRPPAAALAVAALGRAAGRTRSARGAEVTACAAVLAGWLLLDPHWGAWPPPPIARLPGLALILLAASALGTGARQTLAGLALAGVAAWWLRGAPASAGGILYCLPVFLGLAAGLALAQRLARQDARWANLAAALVLAAALLPSGAAVHWARAAVVPGMAGLALLGVADARPAIAGAIVMVAAASLVASDRGRLITVDAACLAPLLAWLVAGRLARLPRSRQPARRWRA